MSECTLEVPVLPVQCTEQAMRTRMAGILRQNSFAQRARARKISPALKRVCLFKIVQNSAFGSSVSIRAPAQKHLPDERSQHLTRFLAPGMRAAIDATGVRNDNVTLYFTRRIAIVGAGIVPRRINCQGKAAPY